MNGLHPEHYIGSGWYSQADAEYAAREVTRCTGTKTSIQFQDGWWWVREA